MSPELGSLLSMQFGYMRCYKPSCLFAPERIDCDGNFSIAAFISNDIFMDHSVLQEELQEEKNRRSEG
ncbi:hypothetical protein CEXT_256011 [Caerostris extrusa]|uniref:Uncharacterized protein n=1 Tax=Caerostris extrusa TaxID=172846 RepID=A0AAV4M4M6_CAEEX|nr:hypothetical protein CEXT_256011 [Caerostris extrusa]